MSRDAALSSDADSANEFADKLEVLDCDPHKLADNDMSQCSPDHDLAILDHDDSL